MPTRTTVRVCKRHHNCGCQVASCCFNCPLPDCDLVAQQRPLTVERQCEARRLKGQGLAPAEIARMMDISVRTVWRALGAS